MTALVLGANGQVGRHLAEQLPGARLWTRAEADLADTERLVDAVRRAGPSAIVNAAAYTAVDRAESQPQLAWQVNAAAVAALAGAASELDIPLVHISTDYVFDGESKSPYRASDGARPLSAYGRTKLAGDLAATLCPRHWVLRPSWVFSAHGRNFVTTMVALARERDALRVVDDQHGRPTHAGDIAALIAALLARVPHGDAPEPGLYHVGGGPQVTWHGFAQTIFERAHRLGLIERRPEVAAIPTREYPTPARRPLRAVLAIDEAFQGAVGVQPDWEAGLDAVLADLAGREKVALYEG